MGLLLLTQYDAAAGPAYQVAVNAGNNQSATVGNGLAVLPQVVVSDSVGNPVASSTVTFTIVTGNGSGSGLTASTDVNGFASIGSFSLGTTAGLNQLTALASGLTGSPVTFSETGLGATAFSVALLFGNGQSAAPSTAVAIAPSVQLLDRYGNTASASTVTFAVTLGGGSVSPTPVVSSNGVAQVSAWTLGAAIGANDLTATASGITGSPVAFSAQAISGGPVDRTNVLWVQPWGVNPWVRLPEVRIPTIVHP